MTLEKHFRKTFGQGCELWTGEDGTLMSIAVSFTRDWVKILKERVESRNPNHPFKPSRVKIRYAFKEWAEPEYWFFKGQKGKTWRLGTEVTPFPVYEYELEQPI
jgi:hypothetical protein